MKTYDKLKVSQQTRVDRIIDSLGSLELDGLRALGERLPYRNHVAWELILEGARPPQRGATPPEPAQAKVEAPEPEVRSEAKPGRLGAGPASEVR